MATATTTTAAKNDDIVLQLPTEIIATDPTPSKANSRIRLLAAFGCCALLLVVVASAVVLVHQATSPTTAPTNDPPAFSIDVNLTLKLFEQHPELLTPPGDEDPNADGPEAEALRHLGAEGIHGTNVCGVFHPANPTAVTLAATRGGIYKKMLDECSDCTQIQYSVPSGLLGPMYPTPSGGYSSDPRFTYGGFKERHPGWGAFVCGKNEAVGTDNPGYGRFRGGSQCHHMCCEKQKNYCERNCNWFFSTFTGGEALCTHKCMGERGCLASRGSGARY